MPLFSLAPTLVFPYAGADTGSGLANFDARYRRAAFNAGFGPLTYPAGWQHTTRGSVSLAPLKGYTFCFSVRSRDKAGNVSAWSQERCTAVPLDDRQLADSSGWTRASSSPYYSGTISRASSTGRSLVRAGVQTRRIGIVANTCPGCGTIGVYWNGRLVRQVSLTASGTTPRRIVTVIDLGSVESGTLAIRTLGTGRVYVDGLGLSRI